MTIQYNRRETYAAGIYVDADSTVSVVIDSLTTTTSLWQYPQIRDGYYGIDVVGHARPVIRGGIIDNHTTCVHIGSTARPDLGDASVGDSGNNLIKNASAKLAGGRLRSPGIPNVLAEDNYWGSSVPDGNRISAWVDYTPYLTSNPLSMSGIDVDLVPVEAPPFARLAYPMPFAGQVTVPLFVAADRTPVEVDIFDVQGRRVRTLVDHRPR